MRSEAPKQSQTIQKDMIATLLSVARNDKSEDIVGGKMAEIEEKDFKCLRCGAVSKFPYQKGVMMERQCPKCGSNSIRLIKEKDKEKEKK